MFIIIISSSSSSSSSSNIVSMMLIISISIIISIISSSSSSTSTIMLIVSSVFVELGVDPATGRATIPVFAKRTPAPKTRAATLKPLSPKDRCWRTHTYMPMYMIYIYIYIYPPEFRQDLQLEVGPPVEHPRAESRNCCYMILGVRQVPNL